MKKSDLKQLRANIQKAAAPQSKKKEDLSDELTSLFDDGTKLQSAQPSSTTGTQSTKSTHSTQTAPSPAPARDFTRVANSIVREAVPAGLFKGKSKQIYDFLYAKTRGAIVPVRTVRLTRREIMEGAHIGSTKTLYLNLIHLRAVGLMNWQEIVGPHGGNEYTVMLPEEIDTQGTPSTMSTQSNSSSKVVGVLGVESTQSTHSLSVDNTDTSTQPKTSIKTTTIDDDKAVALSDLIEIFSDANFKLTGRAPQAADRQRWAELARVLVAELNEAAARADQVSSVPAFLAAHLRRRFAQRQAPAKREGQSKEAATKKISDKELRETALSFADLISQGAYTLETVEAQYADGWHPDNWAKIRSIIISQLEEKGTEGQRGTDQEAPARS